MDAVGICRPGEASILGMRVPLQHAQGPTAGLELRQSPTRSMGFQNFGHVRVKGEFGLSRGSFEFFEQGAGQVDRHVAWNVASGNGESQTRSFADHKDAGVPATCESSARKRTQSKPGNGPIPVCVGRLAKRHSRATRRCHALMFALSVECGDIQRVPAPSVVGVR